MHKTVGSIEPYKLAEVVHAFHPSTQKVETGGLEVQGHPGLCSEFVVSQSEILEMLCPKKKKKKKGSIFLL